MQTARSPDHPISGPPFPDPQSSALQTDTSPLTAVYDASASSMLILIAATNHVYSSRHRRESGNRGIGLALIRQLLARPESAYPTIVGTSRQIVDDELGRLQSEHPERVKRLQLRDVGTVEAVEELADQLKSVAPNGVNVLINNAGRTTQPRHKIFSPLGALEYQAQLQASSFGPLLLSSTLISHGLLSSVAGLKPDINRKPYALSHLADSAHSVSDNPLSRDLTINAKSDPTALAEVPIIANISSTQGSLAYAAELFNGGANRDDLIFHPIYASVKGALSAMTLNLARELRDECIVNAIHPGWVRTEHGRKYAPLSTDESASKILDLIESWKTTADSGQWVDEEGRKVPW